MGGEAPASRSSHKDRRGESRRGEKTSDKVVTQSKGKDSERRSSTAASAPPAGGSSAAAVVKVDSAPAADKERGKEKEKGDKAPVQSLRSSTYRQSSSRAPVAAEGLPEEVLSQIAQAKFDAQEDKLRDVARFSMALLRDVPKLPAADIARKVVEVQKALSKYEMQYIRAWEYQEKRRADEVVRLEAEAERCRKEAEEEGDTTAELRRVLEKERRRRARYEGYEKAAAEVNRKRTRADSEAAIKQTKEDIDRLKRQRTEYEALVEERAQRAQLLQSAVAELAQDLRRERALADEALAKHGGAAAGAGGRSPRATGAAPLSSPGAVSPAPSSVMGGELVEVIS